MKIVYKSRNKNVQTQSEVEFKSIKDLIEYIIIEYQYANIDSDDIYFQYLGKFYTSTSNFVGDVYTIYARIENNLEPDGKFRDFIKSCGFFFIFFR